MCELLILLLLPSSSSYASTSSFIAIPYTCRKGVPKKGGFLDLWNISNNSIYFAWNGKPNRFEGMCGPLTASNFWENVVRIKQKASRNAHALHVEIAKESLDGAVCWRLIKLWCLRIVIIIAIGNCYRYGSFLCEGLDRCWLINTGLEREDCTACGVTGRMKDWDLPPKYEPRLEWSCKWGIWEYLVVGWPLNSENPLVWVRP